MDERLGGRTEAPQRPARPDAKKQLQDSAKRYRKIAADLEELADALGSRVLSPEQNEMLGDLVGAGIESVVNPQARIRLI